jgi:hypothetical protein
MPTLEREFYHRARGPAPSDEDRWLLAFDRATGSLFVRHEWESERHSGVDEYDVAEFLTQQGGAQIALLSLLFGEVSAEAG